jgi:uncharacterized membrane protein (UPF0136 family)
MTPPAAPWAAAAVSALLYGLIALAGGVLGFVNKGSKPSLIAGGVSGLLLIVFGAAAWAEKQWAAIGTLVVALALVGRFAGSLAKAQRQPGGISGTLLGRVGVVMVLGGVLVTLLAIWALAS